MTTSTLDANVLLYGSDQTSPHHHRASELLHRLAEGPELVYLFWPTIMAYLRIATHPAIFSQPLSTAAAMANIAQLLARPHVRSPGEGEAFWSRFTDLAVDVPPAGNLVPDAHLVALMIDNGVRLIWSRDRDFRKFRGIEVRDPFE